MTNITIIGTACAGKSTIMHKLRGGSYKPIIFENILDDYLKDYGGIKAAIKSKNVDYAFNHFGPDKILQILSTNDSIILELGANAIMGPIEETNQKNFKTITLYSTPIAIFPTKDREQAIDMLIEREILRQSHKPQALIIAEHDKFFALCSQYDFEIKYSDEPLNWIMEPK
ncbi:MAG: hypothetical protein ACP5N3_04010 [Candidatus Nanoarchaeia archaeon]